MYGFSAQCPDAFGKNYPLRPRVYRDLNHLVGMDHRHPLADGSVDGRPATIVHSRQEKAINLIKLQEVFDPVGWARCRDSAVNLVEKRQFQKSYVLYLGWEHAVICPIPGGTVSIPQKCSVTRASGAVDPVSNPCLRV